MHRITSVLLAAITLVLTARAPVAAQRVALSGVHRIDTVDGGLAPVDANATRPPSHADGAVHGALIGLGAGALAGVAVYVVAHAFVSSQDTQVVTSNDKVVFFWWSTGLGALAGATIGGVIGGIAGR